MCMHLIHCCQIEETLALDQHVVVKIDGALTLALCEGFVHYSADMVIYLLINVILMLFSQ